MTFKQLSLANFVKPICKEEKYLAFERTTSKLAKDEEYVCQRVAPIKPKNPIRRPRRPQCPQATLLFAAPKDPPPLQSQCKI